MRTVPGILAMTAGVLALCSFSASAANPLRTSRIEATQGKRYSLTKSEGPWMIMVASLRTASPDGTVRDGKTPEQLADELVLELRKKGLPAYVYAWKARTRPSHRRIASGSRADRVLRSAADSGVRARRELWELSDPAAQKTFEIIKAYHPDCMDQGGVSWLKTRRRQGPLGGAFLSINPLLSPEELAQRKDDPLLKSELGRPAFTTRERKAVHTRRRHLCRQELTPISGTAILWRHSGSSRSMTIS